MIWIDSSFAIEWLGDLERIKKIELPKESLAILPMQYAEIFVFFLKKKFESTVISNSLEMLELKIPDKIQLQLAAKLYTKVREVPKNKVSLADAVLATVAKENKETILTFDSDFSSLGFREEKTGFWIPSKM